MNHKRPSTLQPDEREPDPSSDASTSLRSRIAFSILLDECAIAALSDATALMRDFGDPNAPELEHAIRTYRVGIMKHRALFGAVGINV